MICTYLKQNIVILLSNVNNKRPTSNNYTKFFIYCKFNNKNPFYLKTKINKRKNLRNRIKAPLTLYLTLISFVFSLYL